MATIYSLPAPLPLHIAKLVPDLKALDALRQSCGLFAAIFDQHAVELLEYVMLHTLDPGVVMEMRMHVLCLTNGDLWRETDDALSQLRKQAAAPLQGDTPVQAIATTLRTYSYLHSLCFRVATEKLDELYALPHRHPTHPGYVDYRHHIGELYEVPRPSKPHWIEEQRMLRSLLHLRNRGLLDHGLVTPVASPDSHFFSYFYDPVHEVQRFFEPCSQAITTGTIVSVVDWQASPTAPSPGFSCGARWVSAVLQEGIGWEIFHGPTRLMSGTALEKEDWLVFQELGLGIWSDERLADELHLLGAHTFTFTWWVLCKVRLLERRAQKVGSFE
ncbi:hypothetical protein LTR97_009917 [Elasticomyces elasticus]|uniref:Uncharacterized protein n=1 Tax=Elasticomyces elasticus TaxID=574655 RepID=A0AAN7VZV7_9PEZI|nr:hypothetical protein LTR97_009917 [Elasticomyces elasticus]